MTSTSTDRQRELKEALAKCKLTLRNDSSLSKDYISGSNTHTPEEITKELALMHWLHSYTTYSTDLTKIKDALCAQHGPYRGVWRSASRTCKLFLTATLGVPETWPWMEDPPILPTHAPAEAQVPEAQAPEAQAEEAEAN